jgi:RNA-directed DNA polymerase
MELNVLKLKGLTSAKTKPDFANSLEIDPVFLTHCLYIVKPENQYHQFEIDKKSGGKRTINAPSPELKSLQRNLSKLLLDCIDEINKAKFPNSLIASPKMLSDKVENPFTKTLKLKASNTKTKQPALSHGFVRKRSIITNAMMHLGKKNVLNIDLENFFDSFNFGRVRGFFIKNENFQLDPKIATMIAQIACYNNTLPQGSPCSPVITNLITHSLDIRLSQLAKKYKCTYTRYADDITFSTRKSEFPSQVMKEEDGIYIAGKRLRREILNAGFSINENKTRIQYKDSRQDVTGLIVNKKPNTKKEYWRTVRAKCNSLFKTGKFISELDGVEVEGNLNELEGQLNFIDQVDHYNRMRQKAPINPNYQLARHGYNTKSLLSSREKTFSRFLYYRLFYGNDKPTFLCEGQTDNVYLKCAINKQASDYPKLAKAKSITTDYQLLVRFLEYSKRTRFLLSLYGGTSYLNYFISSFSTHYLKFGAPKPEHPVIIVLDNDKGFKGKKDSGIEGKLKQIDTAKSYPNTLVKHDFKKSEYIHVIHNLYIVLTPLNNDKDTMVEDLFDQSTWTTKVDKKSFNPDDNRDNLKEFGKEVFAQKVVKALKSKADFDGFKPLLDRVVKVINHYDSIK